MKTRKNGYYWVKDDDKWEVAEWWINRWYCIGLDESFEDDVFDKIDENQIIRK